MSHNTAKQCGKIVDLLGGTATVVPGLEEWIQGYVHAIYEDFYTQAQSAAKPYKDDLNKLAAMNEGKVEHDGPFIMNVEGNIITQISLSIFSTTSSPVYHFIADAAINDVCHRKPKTPAAQLTQTLFSEVNAYPAKFGLS